MRELLFLAVVLYSLSSVGFQAQNFGTTLQKLVDDEPEITGIEWLDMETADDLNKKDKKYLFIDVYTDWCGWCKRMDQTTFADSAVVAYMNEHFYCVKMDAESKDPIAYNDVLYEYKTFNGKGYNELAVNLLGGQMSFPSFVVLSKKEAKLGTIIGYKRPGELISVLSGYVKK